MKILKGLALVLMLCLSLGVQAGGKSKAKMQTVYVFGFSASFKDSVCFLTDVMKLDSAYILPNGFLADRTLYSLQLENYVLGKCRVANSTNAIFFSKNKKDVEAKYNKVNRMYQRSQDLTLIYVGEDEFHFRPEEYIESTVIEEDPTAVPAGGKPEYGRGHDGHGPGTGGPGGGPGNGGPGMGAAGMGGGR